MRSRFAKSQTPNFGVCASQPAFKNPHQRELSRTQPEQSPGRETALAVATPAGKVS